jgi:hypothetical protein
MSNAVRIQIRRDTAAAWTAANPTLASGEPALETDTRKQKTGDGVTAWNGLAYDAEGGGGSSAAYVHNQGTPATTWTINHNLGFRPAVELLDSGSQEIDGAISHPTVNQTVITLSPATAGLARLL